MLFQSGDAVRVGDAVMLHGMAGVVVFSIDDREYAQDYPSGEWEYLGEGVGVLTQEAGLIHIVSNDDLALIARKDG